MNKKLIISCLLSLFLLTSCQIKNNEEAGETSEEESSLPDDGKSAEEREAYDNWLTSISKPGHLYFHYNRGENKDYSNYCLWLWQHAPNDLEGSLWAYSGNEVVSPTLTLKPMSRSWMTFDDVGKSSEGSGLYVDDYGVIADVDLYRSGLIGGKTGSATSFEGASELGFLLPRQNSMNGKSNWVSDGGKETYVHDIDNASNWRTLTSGGKAIHVFVTTGSLKNYSFYVGSGTPQVRVNPITQDTTGKYRSDTEAYEDVFDDTSTSNAFKSLGAGYQIFVSSFRDSNGDGKGDIRGIIDSLEYLDDLGVKCLWLTPIQKSDSYHGYDTIDYYKVDEKFGTLDDYRELLYKAHEKGMKVIMDLVLNHTSKSNIWFENSQWGVNDSLGKNEWRDVYTWKYGTDLIWKYEDGKEPYQIKVEDDATSDNPSWYRDGESNYYYYGKFGGSMPEINYHNPKTRQMVIDMAKYWLSVGLDGFRLDAVKHIFMRDECEKNSSDIIIEDFTVKSYYDDEKDKIINMPVDYATNLTKNVRWWKEFANALKADYPDCFLVGENFDGWGRRTAPFYQALDSQFSFSHYYHIPSYLYDNDGGATLFANKQADESFNAFSTMGNSDGFIPLDNTNPEGQWIPAGHRPDFIDGAFTSNHDVMRAINQVNGYQGLDEKGNPTHIADDEIGGLYDDVETQVNKAKIHAAVTMLNRGLSWIYYGDELGMSSNTNLHEEKYTYDNNKDIWYRQPMKWDDESLRPHYNHGSYVIEYDEYNSDDNRVPSAEDQQASSSSMFNWYKDLIEIKDMYPVDARITYHPYSSDNVMVIRVDDSYGSPKLVIYINTGKNSKSYEMLPTGIASGDLVNVKTMGGAPAAGDIGTHPYSISVFEVR